jgi:biopolymer transport protein ExbD
MTLSRRQKDEKMLEINLIPMMNVMMAILTFFVAITIVLTAEKGVDVALTGGKNQPPATPEQLPDPLIVELNPQGLMLLNGQAIGQDLLEPTMRSYLDKNPKGAVLLKADQGLPYEQVVDLLSRMRDIGGSRVSLALEESAPAAAAAEPNPATPAAATPEAAATAPEAPAPAAGVAAPETTQPAATEAPPAEVVIPQVPNDYDS